MEEASNDGNIRAKVAVDGGGCPVSSATSESGTRVLGVNRSEKAGGEDMVREEVTVEGGEDFGSEVFEKSFDLGNRDLYEFERESSRPCICDAVEEAGYPVSDVKAEEGVLYVTFHSPSIEEVKEVLGDLGDIFQEVRLKELVRSNENDGEDLVLFDRSNLTGRQEEVLEKAHEMGYFDYSGGANAGEVAEELGIAPSTFAEHISLAQSKILDSYLEDG